MSIHRDPLRADTPPECDQRHRYSTQHTATNGKNRHAVLSSPMLSLTKIVYGEPLGDKTGFSAPLELKASPEDVDESSLRSSAASLVSSSSPGASSSGGNFQISSIVTFTLLHVTLTICSVPSEGTSLFPAPWKKAYITTLYKKGAKNDPANYRPISITSCFGKVFTSVLNVCLMSFMVDKNIAHPFQGAFTKGKRGTDHILVANTLIDQARHTGNPLYAAFIDLQKAYDSVCHPLLFRKWSLLV